MAETLNTVTAQLQLLPCSFRGFRGSHRITEPQSPGAQCKSAQGHDNAQTQVAGMSTVAAEVEQRKLSTNQQVFLWVQS
ncbi:hypothetical protein NDU88_007078 [Pleurodeles waltl]|uniref:Uncharacterized protein n=1 Tax=Pleurodeles waltl TaxID=8319 RepID=A0AAV7RND2_PLEWA|nr:hypothetical protein NDU88_007078 [Pleurodeles waltl]